LSILYPQSLSRSWSTPPFISLFFGESSPPGDLSPDSRTGGRDPAASHPFTPPSPPCLPSLSYTFGGKPFLLVDPGSPHCLSIQCPFSQLLLHPAKRLLFSIAVLHSPPPLYRKSVCAFNTVLSPSPIRFSNFCSSFSPFFMHFRSQT